ncbi:restriction endonuclease subunit S [Candidatus Palauibacter sp.]|uniref:restriction endonuclease subunit S n=1 Tax=Candidatus Palauibacter sp. TaxID=3101350 RepID=UPI003B5975E5
MRVYTPIDPTSVLPEYLYHMLSSMDLNSYTQRAAKGPTLNKRIISQIRIPVPSIEKQQEFIDRMHELEATAIQRLEQAREFEKERYGCGGRIHGPHAKR